MSGRKTNGMVKRIAATPETTSASAPRKWLDQPILRNGLRPAHRPACQMPACQMPACQMPACQMPACQMPACHRPACQMPACQMPARPAAVARRSPARAVPVLAAGAVLAVTGAAGCTISQVPSGMEKQIIRGEQVGAATRAHASPLASARVASTELSSTHGTVTGRRVTAIGDSVMSASAMALESALPGIYIDAKPDRQMPAGLDLVRSLARRGRLRPIVVMGLGTNYIVTTSELQQLMKLIGPDRKLVLINTYVPDQWSKEVNATEARFIQRHPAVVRADWFDTIKNRTYLLWPDHIHPQMPGTTVYARMVYRAIQATRDITATRPAAASVTAGNVGS